MPCPPGRASPASVAWASLTSHPSRSVRTARPRPSAAGRGESDLSPKAPRPLVARSSFVPLAQSSAASGSSLSAAQSPTLVPGQSSTTVRATAGV
jgi:hypothetical protein